jgi:hypothetical protein
VNKLAIFAFMILSGCSIEPMHVQQAEKIRNSFTKIIEKTEGWKLFGEGGSVMDNIKKIHLSYTAFECVDIAQARRLIVEKVEALLDKINSDAVARPYLHNYPFTYANIRFSISFIDEMTNHYIKSPTIASVNLNVGKIFYSIYNEELGMFETVYKEPYEDALKIYLEDCQKPSLSEKM